MPKMPQAPLLELRETTELAQSETVPLEALGKITVGYQLRQSVVPEPEGEHTLIQVRNVQDGHLDTSDLTRMTLDARTIRGTVQPGDILLRSRGASYGAALVADVPENAVALVPLFVLRLHPNHPDSTVRALGEYVVWFINRAAIQSLLKTMEGGTHNPSVGLTTFKTLPILLPPLEIQREIVEIDGLARRARDLAMEVQAARDKQVAAVLEKMLAGMKGTAEGKGTNDAH